MVCWNKLTRLKIIFSCFLLVFNINDNCVWHQLLRQNVFDVLHQLSSLISIIFMTTKTIKSVSRSLGNFSERDLEANKIQLKLFLCSVLITITPLDSRHLKWALITFKSLASKIYFNKYFWFSGLFIKILACSLSYIWSIQEVK